MCEHCERDMTSAGHPSQAEHDGWLYPHGRAGYSGVTHEMIAAAEAACTWCPKRTWTAAEAGWYESVGLHDHPRTYRDSLPAFTSRQEIKMASDPWPASPPEWLPEVKVRDWMPPGTVMLIGPGTGDPDEPPDAVIITGLTP